MLERLAVPLVQAPMAGGPSTPQLTAAVANAGGLGFAAAGYRTPEAFAADLAATRALTDGPIGANLFAPAGAAADPSVVAAYAERLAPEAARAGVELGTPRFDDDAFDAKLAVLAQHPVHVVSFAFALPPPHAVAAVHASGAEVWVTVTHPGEARLAVAAGADALVVQGVEAGGHRGSFDDGPADIALLALLQLVRAAVDVPLVATGGLATAAAVAAVLAAGAAAAQAGTAFLLCPEAGTARALRDAVAAPGRTALTRAFTGRLARGIENRLLREHSAAAPSAYPELHHLTAPLRAHGRAAGDADLINLWAGQAHELARPVPAAEVVRALAP
ncbi:MAG: nitronate monooxygenase [Solirubrobacteraceae bacterium]